MRPQGHSTRMSMQRSTVLALLLLALACGSTLASAPAPAPSALEATLPLASAADADKRPKKPAVSPAPGPPTGAAQPGGALAPGDFPGREGRNSGAAPSASHPAPFPGVYPNTGAQPTKPGSPVPAPPPPGVPVVVPGSVERQQTAQGAARTAENPGAQAVQASPGKPEPAAQQLTPALPASVVPSAVSGIATPAVAGTATTSASVTGLDMVKPDGGNGSTAHATLPGLEAVKPDISNGSIAQRVCYRFTRVCQVCCSGTAVIQDSAVLPN